MVLVRLNQVEVATITLHKAVVSIELELGSGSAVGSGIKEWDRTSGGTDRTGGISGRVEKGKRSTVRSQETHATTVRIGRNTRSVGSINSIGIVEPLRSTDNGTGNIGSWLNSPDQLLARVVEVELDLVVGVSGRLRTSVLELLN
jgi:hypothetical protein